MDNKNNNKLNSKDLEQSALEMLNKAVSVDFSAAEKKSKAISKISEEPKEVSEKKPTVETKSTEEPKEVSEKKPTEETKSTEKPKAVSEKKPTEETKSTEKPKAVSEKKPTEEIKSIEKPKEVSEKKPTEETKSTEKPKAVSEKKPTEETKSTEKPKAVSEEKSAAKTKSRTKEDVDKEDEQTKEELRNLICTAIENKKILRKANVKPEKEDSQDKQGNQDNRGKEKNVPSKESDKSHKDSSKSGTEKKVSENQPPKVKAKPIASDDLNDLNDSDNLDEWGDDDEEQEIVGNKKGFFSKYKKTKITIIAFVSVIVLVILFVIFMFLRYMGFLKRNGDNSKNYNSMPVNDSDIVGGDDTFNKKKKEEELKKRLAKNAKPISDSDVFNVLIIGEDVRDPKETGRGNTDVMMIASINKKNKTITLTSLLRDAWVYLDEYNTSNKLNAAFWHGGSDYLEKVVEQYYGIEIDRYVSVNFQSFIDIVEAVGGLDFNVKANEAEAMKDPLNEVNDILGRKRNSGFVKAGKQHLDGYQSLAYARIRYNCGDDYGRTKRQRAVISQIIKKSKNLGLLELDSLLKKVLKKVTTDITNSEAASMLLDAFDYMNYSVQQLQIPSPGYFESGTVNGLSVLLPDFDMNSKIIQNVVYGTAKNAKEAAKQIAEGTGFDSTQSSKAAS